MALHINTRVYVPHLDKWGIILQRYEGQCQVKFTECNEVNTYETIHNARLIPYFPTSTWVKYSGLRACVLSATYDAAEHQFRYRIHVGADEFPCYPTDYLPTDQEYNVIGYDLDYAGS